jgi:integrase
VLHSRFVIGNTLPPVFVLLLSNDRLRASEVATLTWEDVDLTAGTLMFYRPKVAQSQRLALSTRLQRSLRLYRDYLQMQDVLLDKLLIGITRKGAPGKLYLSPQSISNIVQQIGLRYGIEKLSAHDCRHHCITYLIQEKQVNPMTVQDFGGWKDARMVRHYVRQLDVSNSDFVDDMYDE